MRNKAEAGEAREARQVLLFPGQGAQKVGMGRDLYEGNAAARAVFDGADERLAEVLGGARLSRLCFEGPAEVLADTAVQQPALACLSLAVLSALEAELGRPLARGACAGLSLGEYSALAAAGVLDLQEAIYLAAMRGKFMKEASVGKASGMAVVMALAEEKIRECCAEAAVLGVVAAVNFNCPGQVVIAGEQAALARASALCRAAGAKRVLPLKVSGAFHTALMAPATERLREVMDRLEWRQPVCPIVSNVSADYAHDTSEIRRRLLEQLTAPVLWEASMRRLISDGYGPFLELGAGKVLAGLMAGIAPTAEVFSVGGLEEVQRLARKNHHHDGSGSSLYH